MMSGMLINWLKNADKYEIKNRGTVYAGPAPFGFDKESQDDMNKIYQKPWVISHPDARDKLWKVIGLESWAIQCIRQGAPIGLLVKPYDAKA